MDSAASQRDRTILSHSHLVAPIVNAFLKRRSLRGMEREDVLSEARIALIGAVDDFNPARGATLSTHIRTRVKNHLQHLFRDDSREMEPVTSLNHSSACSIPDAVDVASLVENRLVIQDALETLAQTKPRRAQALKLFFYEQRSKTEIAQHFNCSLFTACYYITRGLSDMKALLADCEF